MNSDLATIRDARMFRNLPDRAFNKISSLIRVRAYMSGEDATPFSTQSELRGYFGYIVRGRVLFMSSADKPLGLAVRDEFFLGKPFILNDQTVEKLVSASDETMIVYIPSNVISILTSASRVFGEMLEDIYDTIHERSKLVVQDGSAEKTIQQWISTPDSRKTLGGWVDALSKKQSQAAERRAKEARRKSLVWMMWSVGIALAIAMTVESLARHFHSSLTFIDQVIPYFLVEEFEPGSRWNILLGIIGYALVLSTLLHTVVKWGIRKFKWKVNFQISQSLHILVGILGSYLIVLHTAFSLTGANIAYFALYAVLISLFTGFVGQFISSQIPKTIRGEKLKLDALKLEQQKLQQKAEMLMGDDQMYKTSLMMISQGVPHGFWSNIFLAPLLWVRSLRVKGNLMQLGLGDKGAGLAAELIRKEFQLRQKVKFLEMSNAVFKRWMIIHIPIGWTVYVLGAIHVILVLLSI